MRCCVPNGQAVSSCALIEHRAHCRCRLRDKGRSAECCSGCDKGAVYVQLVECIAPS